MGEKLTRKTDRLPPVSESSGQRQLVRISTTVKVGDREVVRVRPYHPHLRQPRADQHRIRRPACRRSTRRSCWRRPAPTASRWTSRPAPSPTPKSPTSRANSRADPAAHQARRRASDRRDHRPRARHRELDRRRAAPATRSRACRREAALRSPMRPTARPILTPASRPASFRKTSRCLPKTGSAGDRRQRLERARGHGEEGREHRDDPQGDRRAARRNLRDRIRARPARPQERAQGRPEAPHPGRHRRRPAPAADPRHRHGRQHDRSGGRALRRGPLRLGRRRQHEHAGGRTRQRRRRGRRQGACGSTRASTRPRCATTFRSPSSRR